MNQKYLRVFFAALALALVAGPALEAKNKKGDKFLKDGQAAETKGDWDTALRLYQQAVDENPADPSYLIAMRHARFEAGQMHVDKGQKLRSDGKVQEAVGEFQRAIIADPASAIGLQELKRTQQMLDRANQAGVKPDEAGLTTTERMRRESEQRVASMQGPPELKPVLRQVPTLKMNNQPPRILYETVGKLAGISVVFDSQYTPPTRGFNVDLGNSTVEQAFDYLAVLTHTFWKPITPTTIFVTEDNVTKRRDYEDEVVKVFYVTNATSVQEFQEIATAIRTVGDIRRVYTYNAQKAMVVRGTVDQIALTEKLVRDLDRPKSEVVIDLIFMEANSARTRDLAATIATAGTAGLNVPIAFTPRNSIALGSSGSTATTGTTGTTGIPTGITPATGTSSTSSIALNNLSHISTADFATTLPGALLEAMLSDNRTKVLNQPQVRMSDGQKGELQIGDRIPYATGSFQPGVGTVGVSPLVSTQFQFIDTGITMVITPQVHSTSEVTLHVEITISAVKQYLNLGGLSQPVVTQNKSITDLRLRDGEVSILGGLNNTQDSSSVNGIPGLVDIPVLGKLLFGSTHTENDRSQLMIALIPHVVRSPDYSPENLRGIYAGSDQVVKISYAAPEEPSGSAPAPPAAGAPAPPAAVAPATPAAPAPAAGAAPAGAAPTGDKIAGATPGIAGATPDAAPGQARLSFSPTPIQVARNSTFTVTIQLDNASEVFSLSPLRIKYDPALVRLDDAAAGGLLGPVTAVKDIRNDNGEATLTVARMAGAGGVTGSGPLATLTFSTLGPGAGSISITEAGLKNSQLQAVPVSLANVPVTVQ